MRFLKVLTIVMGVLIVVATTVLVVLIARRLGGPATVAGVNCGAAGRAGGDADRGDRLGGGSAGGAVAGWRAGSRAAGRSAHRRGCWADRAAQRRELA